MHTDNLLTCVEINPTTPAKKNILWLHGLGADANDFVPLIPELRLPSTLPIRFVFPNAPIMPVTINNGYKMPAWYDIFSLAEGGKIDEAGIQASTRSVKLLIEREIANGFHSTDIFLAGFSQGAVIALTTGLQYAKPLAGIIALSGYLPFNNIETIADEANCNTPLFMAHGLEDGIVPCTLGEMAYIALKKAGYTIDWHTYPMAHSVCAKEVDDLSQWIQTKSVML